MLFLPQAAPYPYPYPVRCVVTGVMVNITESTAAMAVVVSSKEASVKR